jgi:hypothetical protein
MHGDLIIHFSKAQQDEIVRVAGSRLRRSPGRTPSARWPRLRPALPGGGMLPSWRHGSPARGS